jgi:hypothetical protein
VRVRIGQKTAPDLRERRIVVTIVRAIHQVAIEKCLARTLRKTLTLVTAIMHRPWSDPVFTLNNSTANRCVEWTVEATR